jgi:Bacterial tandem repeat domain 1
MVGKMTLFALAVFALALFVPPVGAADKSWSGLSEKELNKIFDEYKAKGWHPTAIKGFNKDGKDAFDMTWSNGKLDEWYLYYDMSPDAFEKRKAEFAAKGLKVVSESTWKVGKDTRVAAVWHKK